MNIAAFILLGLTLLFAVIAIVAVRLDKREGSYNTPGGPIAVVSGIVSVVLLLLTLIAGWLAVAPEYRLYKANIEKRIIVTTAKAEADADIEHARGEVERAKGTAAANKIVAHSITEPYLRYLYINNIAHSKNQIIYIPTEGALPILEAGKRS